MLISLILSPILDSKQRDTGLYTCLIKTASGQTSASASVTVAGPGAEVSGLDTVTDLLAFPASPSKPRRQASSGPGSVTMVWGKPHRVGASPLRGYQVMMMMMIMMMIMLMMVVVVLTSDNDRWSTPGQARATG